MNTRSVPDSGAPAAHADTERVQARDEYAVAVRRFFDSQGGLAHTRRGLESREPDPHSWRRLTQELGANRIHIPENLGGDGFGLPELAVLLAESGRVLYHSPLVSGALMATYLLLAMDRSPAGDALLAKLASGDARATVAIAEPGCEWDAQTVRMQAVERGGQLELDGEKIGVIDETAGTILVVARRQGTTGDQGLIVVEVERGAAGVCSYPANSLDLTRPVHSLRFQQVRGRVLGSGAASDAAAIGRAMDIARIGLAAEMVGAAQACLDAAVEYVKMRRQFGRAIGTFQAIKHRLADMLSELELARAMVDEAVSAAAAPAVIGSPSLAELASIAKVQAGHAFLQIALDGLHLHGAIGFTWEHNAHLFVRRAKASDVFLGTRRFHRQRIARAVAPQIAEEFRTHTSAGTWAQDSTDAFREQVRQWLALRRKPAHWSSALAIGVIQDIDTSAQLACIREWNKTKFDAGWAGIAWPVKYGGRGGTLAELLAWKMEIAGFDAPEGVWLAGESLVGPILLEHGTQAQRERHLARILRGETIWCQLFSETEAGSDLASLRTTARRTEQGWRIQGKKIWTSIARFSDYGLLLARTGSPDSRHKGITCFMLDLRTQGVDIQPIQQMNGHCSFAQVFLDDVLIPDENRVGEVGDGWRVANSTLTHERLELGLRRGVVMKRLWHLAALMQTERAQPPDPVHDDRLAGLHIRLECLGALGRSLIARALSGEDAGPLGSITKLVGAQLMNEAANLALDMQGPLGLLAGEDAPESGAWQTGFLSAPARRLGGGSDEIQRNVIAERFLKLPRE